MVLRALASVFAQTWQALEVIVVVDGPDNETMTALGQLADPRLHVIANPTSLTAAGARNRGVDHARGEWIAFLDDDDEWLPGKIATQLDFANSRNAEFVVCLNEVVTPLSKFIWPETVYKNDEAIDEYLFDRKSIFSGSRFIQTSSYLIKRDVFQRSPFRVDSPHDDWDFLLRQRNQFGIRIETVPEVLVRLYVEERRPSLSGEARWRASYDWVASLRSILTRRAFSGFCLGVVGPRAAHEKAYRAIPILLFAAFRHGAPTVSQISAFVVFWLLPQELRRRIRAFFRGQGSTTSPEPAPLSDA